MQSQKNSKNSVQVGGNLTIVQSGFSLSDLKEITEDNFLKIWRQNFPELKKEAMLIAEKNVSNFIEKFDHRLKITSGVLDLERFKNPNIQYIINQSLQSVARKGESIADEILVEMLVEKFFSKESVIKSLVTEEAIRIIPRISKEQIALITFLHFMNSVKVVVETRKELDLYFEKVIGKCDCSFTISETNLKYLEYVGLLVKNIFLKKDIERNINQLYFELINYEVENKDIETKNINRAINQYKQIKLNQFYLTSVGEIIALTNLKNIESIDLEKWVY